jgi:2-oxoglutarate ferredoxin oxidoreductase subunit beta
MKDHDEPLHEMDFVPFFEEIQVDIAEGETKDVPMHDGSLLRLKKLGRDYDPTDKFGAIKMIHETQAQNIVATGILYVNTEAENFLQILNLTDEPLATLDQSRIRPSREALETVMEELR